jgi:hypothetical protein
VFRRGRADCHIELLCANGEDRPLRTIFEEEQMADKHDAPRTDPTPDSKEQQKHSPTADLEVTAEDAAKVKAGILRSGDPCEGGQIK